MGAAKFILPLHGPDDPGKKLLRNIVVDAEGCAGLYVHRTHLDEYSYVSPWRVSTVIGLRAYVGRLNTRAEARRMAHTLSEVLPPQVLSGEWTGVEWAANDPEAAARYQKEFFGMRQYTV